MSQNGRGKTTILETMYCLMSMLAKDKPTKLGHEDLDDGRGRVQWDLRLKLDWHGEKHCVVLSLLAGKDKPVMIIWSKTQLEKYGATAWHKFGFRHQALGNLKPIGEDDQLIDDLLANIRAEISSPSEQIEQVSLPTLLLQKP